MRALPLLIALSLLTGALAGCIGDEEPTDVEPASDELDEEVNGTDESNLTRDEPELSVSTTWKNSTWEGASAPGFYYCFPPVAIPESCDNAMVFPVPAGAQAVVGEIAWEGEADVFFRVLSDNGTVASTEGASPLQITVTDELPEEDVEWELDAWVDSTTPAEIEATFVASVVEAGELPDGYARFEPGPG